MNVLILGGTGEARALATILGTRPALHATLSLAGRTRAPLLPGCAVRVGGFGGADGLADWLVSNRVDMLVDATHPFARRISANAERAAGAVRIPLVVLERSPWQRVEADRWICVTDMDEAAAVLIPEPGRRVLLAVGRQEVAPFRAAPQHRYVVRSIEPVAPSNMPPRAVAHLARGPFPEVEEKAFLVSQGIELVVSKNSGGVATYGKIAAARRLGLSVVMVDRSARPGAVQTIAAALERLDQVAASVTKRGV